MREATVRNLCAETLSLSSFMNGNSFGLLRAPNGLPLPYLLPLVKSRGDLRCGFMRREVSPPTVIFSTVIFVFLRAEKTVRMPPCPLSPLAAL